MIEQFLSNMFEGEQSQFVIVSGIQVLLILLEFRRLRFEFVIVNSFFSSVDGQLEFLVQGVLESIVFSVGVLYVLCLWFSCFYQFLLEFFKLELLQMIWGMLVLFLGNMWLYVVKFLVSVLSVNDVVLMYEFLVLDVFNIMLDFFFYYVFNNFLYV